MKLRCQEFIFEVTKQVEVRLPSHTVPWNSIKPFASESILKQVKPPVQDMPVLKLFKGNIGPLDPQYRCCVSSKGIIQKTKLYLHFR